jgi:dihydrofolate reductase
MRKLILKMSVSVDGFVCGPNKEIDWIFKSMDEEATAWVLDTIWQAGIHIMGSRTFYDMQAYWPYSNEPFAAPMNEIPKIFFSKNARVTADNGTTQALRDATAAAGKHASTNNAKSADLASWTNAPVASGDLKDEIMKLKHQDGKDILAHGGASFAQSLVKLNLIDEYQLLTHPVALGKGLGLFATLLQALNLKLNDSKSFKGGAVAHIYHPA